jgi:3-oxoacyl-ACP reductase-like protein
MTLNNEIRMAALTMTVSFAATFAYLWWQRGAAVADATPAPRLAAAPRASAPPRPIIAAPAPVAAPAPAAPKIVPIDAPKQVLPPANLDGPPLPLLVAVNPRPVSADNSEDAADGKSSNQVEILNTSEQLLAVTVIDVNGPTQKTSSTQVLLQPNGRAHVGSEAGLAMESGDSITLRSAGFRDMTQTVP